MRLKVAKYLKLLKPQLVVIEQSSALNGTNNNIDRLSYYYTKIPIIEYCGITKQPVFSFPIYQQSCFLSTIKTRG
jgi:hypothetical protein